MIADYIDQFIMFCAGLWMSCVGFGLLAFPIQANSGRPGWLEHLVRHFRWMGPLLVVIAIVLAVAK
ncbi:hypothetical protein [Mesorhizobium amorphae]